MVRVQHRGTHMRCIIWTDYLENWVLRLDSQGLPPREIAVRMGRHFTRGMIIGKLWRMKREFKNGTRTDAGLVGRRWGEPQPA